MTEVNNTELSIEERNGAVVLWLGDKYGILPPDQAMEIGKALTHHGYHAKTGLQADGQKIISEMIMQKLIKRVSLVIKNLQDRKKKPMFVAQEVVEIVLREVV